MDSFLHPAVKAQVDIPITCEQVSTLENYVVETETDRVVVPKPSVKGGTDGGWVITYPWKKEVLTDAEFQEKVAAGYFKILKRPGPADEKTGEPVAVGIDDLSPAQVATLEALKSLGVPSDASTVWSYVRVGGGVKKAEMAEALKSLVEAKMVLIDESGQVFLAPEGD